MKNTNISVSNVELSIIARLHIAGVPLIVQRSWLKYRDALFVKQGVLRLNIG